jgi:hypothetical protein
MDCDPSTGYCRIPDNTITDSGTKSYVIDLLLSAATAVLVTYVFLSMLGFLPYIGSGIANEGMMTFGQGRLAPPGNDGLQRMNNRIAQGAGGGGGK